MDDVSDIIESLMHTTDNLNQSINGLLRLREEMGEQLAKIDNLKEQIGEERAQRSIDVTRLGTAYRTIYEVMIFLDEDSLMEYSRNFGGRIVREEIADILRNEGGFYDQNFTPMSQWDEITEHQKALFMAGSLALLKAFARELRQILKDNAPPTE